VITCVSLLVDRWNAQTQASRTGSSIRVGAVRESASLGIRRSVEGQTEHEAKFSFPAALKDSSAAAATPTGIALVQVSLYCQHTAALALYTTTYILLYTVE
jgi:hypothetical protein